MGSPFTIICYHADSSYARQVSDQAFRLVDSLVAIYSNYIDSSELNRVSATAGTESYVKLSPALFDIIIIAQTAYKRSDHVFDITIGPLTDLWRSARKEKIFPSEELVEAARESTGFKKLVLNKRRMELKLKQPGMRLDLGGIAQGYIAQKTLEYMQNASIRSVLVDVSGDLAIGDPPPGKKAWIVGVNLPGTADALQDKKLGVSNVSVSTSGDVFQFIEHKGKRYSHIVDPRTGYGVTDGKNVTVIAKDATTADWLATACSILPVKKAKKLAHKMRAEILLAYIQDGNLVTTSSKGFKNRLDGIVRSKEEEIGRSKE